MRSLFPSPISTASRMKTGAVSTCISQITEAFHRRFKQSRVFRTVAPELLLVANENDTGVICFTRLNLVLRICNSRHQSISKRAFKMELLATAPVFAAAGYSAMYLLGGGGLVGAAVIFVVAKMTGH